jgi:hypothetical protein
MQVKRTARETDVARWTRIARDKAYRACGYNKDDETYQAIVWALAEVRRAARS